MTVGAFNADKQEGICKFVFGCPTATPFDNIRDACLCSACTGFFSSKISRLQKKAKSTSIGNGSEPIPYLVWDLAKLRPVSWSILQDLDPISGNVKLPDCLGFLHRLFAARDEKLLESLGAKALRIEAHYLSPQCLLNLLADDHPSTVDSIESP